MPWADKIPAFQFDPDMPLQVEYCIYLYIFNIVKESRQFCFVFDNEILDILPIK